ncbi:MAG: hypothetical protein ACUVQH_14435 [Thermogutta sp.]
MTPEDVVWAWLGDGGEFSICDRLPIFLGALAILIGGIAWGAIILRVARLKLSLAETFGLGLPIGLNFLSTLVLLTGLLGWLDQRWLFAGLIIVPVLVGSIRGLRTKLRHFKADNLGKGGNFQETPIQPYVASLMPNNGLQTLFAVAFIIFAVIIVLGAALPPTDFDVREYHLQCPKEFFWHHRITFLPHNVYGNMPLGTEMHPLLGMILLNDVFTGALAGKVVIATFAVLGGILAGRLIPHENDRFNWVTPALFISVPWVAAVSIAGLNDVALSVYIFAAFFAIARALFAHEDWLFSQAPKARADSRKSKEIHEQVAGHFDSAADAQAWAWIALGGYLAGAAAACKYTGLVFGVLLVGAYLLINLKGKLSLRGILKALAIYLGAVILGGGAWYMKNLLLAGNPVYPLAYDWFGGATWDGEKASQWLRVHSPHGFSAHDLARDLGRILLTSEWQSALVVSVAALGVLKINGKAKVLAGCTGLIAGLVLIWWFLTHRIDRFWFPIFPFLCVLATTGVYWSRHLWWRWFVGVTSAIVITWNLLAIVGGVAADNRYFALLSQLRYDPTRIGPDHVLLNRLFAELRAKGDEKRLLAVGDAAIFELEMPVLYATCFDDQPWETLTKEKTPEEIGKTLHQANVGYVYVNWREIERYRSPGNYGFTPFVQPEQFHELVRAGVLVPVLMPAGSDGQIYLVP